MKLDDPSIVSLAIRKARQSSCRHKISAIGISKKGDIIGTATNRPRFDHASGSSHAEAVLMLSCGKNLRTIIICRVGKGGMVKPIDPCATCLEKANELGIKIVSVEGREDAKRRKAGSNKEAR